MNSKTVIVILIGTLVPITVFMLIILVVWFIRRRSNNSGYSKVNHELDGEEIEFKRMIEKRADDDVYDDELFGGDDDVTEFSFDSKDKNRLNMLEKFRNNLVAGATGLDNSNSESESESESHPHIRV
jgi:hypothetical protein